MTTQHTINILWMIIERDLRTLVKSPWIIIHRAIYFVIQLFIFAALVSTLVASALPNYFSFFSIGVIVTTITSTAFIIGMDLFEEKEMGILEYLLSLPFSHTIFVLGRAIGGALRSLIYVFPMFIVVAILNHYTSIPGFLYSLAILFVLAAGISGLSITIAMIVKSENRFDVGIALAELATVRISAAIYPIYAMPLFVRGAAQYSPVTFASDIMRGVVLGGTFSLYEPLSLLLFVGVFFAVGSAFLFKRLEGGRYD